MTLGGTLSAAREQAGLSVEDVAKATRIRGQLIRQIEAGDYSACGGTVYARGHVRAIAATVGLDPAGIVAEFDALHGEPAGPAPHEVFEHEVLALPERKGPNWTAAMAVAAAIALVTALVTLLNPNPASTVAGPRDGIDNRTPAPKASAPAVTSSPDPAPTDLTAHQPYDGRGVVLLVRVVGDKSWVRIVDERNQQVFQGVLQRGEAREFRGARLLSVVLGNAGAVQLVVNGRDLGSPGRAGQVVRTQFGPGDPTAGG